MLVLGNTLYKRDCADIKYHEVTLIRLNYRSNAYDLNMWHMHITCTTTQYSCSSWSAMPFSICARENRRTMQKGQSRNVRNNGYNTQARSPFSCTELLCTLCACVTCLIICVATVIKSNQCNFMIFNIVKVIWKANIVEFFGYIFSLNMSLMHIACIFFFN
jgi:hypothetical protein